MKRKKNAAPLLVLAVALLCLAGCAKRETLCTVEDGDRTVTVLGGGGKVNYVSVSEDGHEIWQTRVYADRTVGERDGSYGVRVVDVNFDGRNDLIVALTVTGEVTTEQVFLQQTDGTYRVSTQFEEKGNLAVDERQELVFGFAHTDQTERDVETDRTYHVTTDTATAYSWQGSTLVPRRSVSLTYYGNKDLYCYSVAEFDAALGAWKDSDDIWLSPAEQAAADLSALYYFR